MCALIPRPEPQYNISVGQIYDLHKIRAHEQLSHSLLYQRLYKQLSQALFGCDDPAEVQLLKEDQTPANDEDEAEKGNPKDKKSGNQKNKNQGKGNTGKNIKEQKNQRIKEKDHTLRTLLLPSVEYGGDIIDHVLAHSSLDPRSLVVFPLSTLPLSAALILQKRDEEKKTKQITGKDKETSQAQTLELSPDAPFIAELCSQFANVCTLITIFFVYFIYCSIMNCLGRTISSKSLSR